MRIQIKHKNKQATYGSWLMLEQVDEALLNAIKHNIPNIKYPVKDYLDQVFQNIIKEFDYIKELDRGYSIADSDIDITYEMLYHTDHSLMFEGTGRVTMYPRRIYIKEE